MDKVLVTGAYGFLGRHVVQELVDAGYRVRAFGRDAAQLTLLESPSVEIAVGDLLDPASLARACDGVDVVIHCAALLKSWGRREDFFAVNVDGTRNVLSACANAHVKRLVHVSSPSVHPLVSNMHIREEDYNPNNRVSFYVESKIAAEQLVRGQHDVPFAIIRPRGICGVGDKNMLPALMRVNDSIGIPLFEHGQVVVDLCCVQNVAHACRLCLEHDEALGQAYDISNGEPRKLVDLVESAFPKLGLTPRYIRLPFRPVYAVASVLEGFHKLFRIYDRAPAVTRHDLCTVGHSQVFDIGKAQRELGYAPVVTLDEMIEQYAAAYRAGQL